MVKKNQCTFANNIGIYDKGVNWSCLVAHVLQLTSQTNIDFKFNVYYNSAGMFVIPVPIFFFGCVYLVPIPVLDIQLPI